jgi:hypothetical protein
MSAKSPIELGDLGRGNVVVEGGVDNEDARSVDSEMIDKHPAAAVILFLL